MKVFRILNPYIYLATAFLQFVLFFLLDSKLCLLSAGCFFISGLLNLEDSFDAIKEQKELANENSK